MHGHTEDSPLLPVPGEVFRLRKLVPQTPAYDFNIHIMDFSPGEHLNVKEMHYNQHGLLLLAGKGIYRLNEDWHAVQVCVGGQGGGHAGAGSPAPPGKRLCSWAKGAIAKPRPAIQPQSGYADASSSPSPPTAWRGHVKGFEDDMLRCGMLAVTKPTPHRSSPGWRRNLDGALRAPVVCGAGHAAHALPHLQGHHPRPAGDAVARPGRRRVGLRLRRAQLQRGMTALLRSA